MRSAIGSSPWSGVFADRKALAEAKEFRAVANRIEITVVIELGTRRIGAHYGPAFQPMNDRFVVTRDRRKAGAIEKRRSL